MDDIVKIVKPLESSCLLINGATETVKHEMKKQKCGFLGAMMAPMPSSLIQSVALSLINAISRKGVMGAGKWQKGGYLPLLTFPLMIKDMPGKEITREERGYKNMGHMDKIF